MDDLRIIELYFGRDEQAIKETDAKYGKLCHSIAYNILNNHEDSEECVNDTYVGVWNAIPPTRPNNFMSFVCRIARNLSLKRLEFMKREKRSAGCRRACSKMGWDNSIMRKGVARPLRWPRRWCQWASACRPACKE